MKIAYLLPNLHVTGGSRVGIELGCRLAERGHGFFILIPRGRHRLPVQCNIEVIECGPRTTSPLIAVIYGMVGMMSRLPAVDVVIASMPTYALLAYFMGWLRNQAAINYVLNDDVHFFDDGSFISNPLLLSIYRAIARLSVRRGIVITNSHWTAVKCVAEGGRRPAAIVPSGYDPHIFHPDKGEDNTGDGIRIVTVGRHVKWKGFVDLLEALNIVDQSKYPFQLRVITQDDLNLSGARFPIHSVKPGNDSELADHYRWGDIFVHSSWFEGFGLPPLEAQACGLAVVATDSGGVKEFLRDDENALLVSPREPWSLAKAICHVIENGDLRRRLIERGLESCKEFTWDRMTDRLEQTLKGIVNRSK